MASSIERFKGNHHNKTNNKKRKQHKDIPAELIEPNQIFISNISSKFKSDKELASDLRKTLEVLVGYPFEDADVIIKNKKPFGGYNAFAFIKFNNPESAKRVLNITAAEIKKLDRRFCRMTILPAKKQIIMPWQPGYCKLEINDAPYDLEPLVPSKACGHILNDYMLLKIFDYLSFKDLVILDIVCRRWRSLVYANFRARTNKQFKEDIIGWFLNNNFGKDIRAFSKLLLINGDVVEKIGPLGTFKPGPMRFFIDDRRAPVTFLKILGKLCSNLKAISIYSTYKIAPDFLNSLSSCTKVEEFVLVVPERLMSNDAEMRTTDFRNLLKALPNLKVLRLGDVFVDAKCFENVTLPTTLMELQIRRMHGYDMRISSLSGLLNCHDLEVLELDFVSLTDDLINKIGENCKNLIILKICVYPNCDINWGLFKNLTTLQYNGCGIDLQKLIDSLPLLETLSIDITEDDMENPPPNEDYDFSKLPSLKNFVYIADINFVFKLTDNTLISFLKCKKLKEFNCNNLPDSHTFILQLIKECQELSSIECRYVTMKGPDVMDYVKAHKNRQSKLKLVIGLDQEAMDQVEKLEEANYEIQMFDTNNIFNDTDDDYEDDLFGIDSDDYLTDDDEDFDFDEDYEDLFGLNIPHFLCEEDIELFMAAENYEHPFFF